MNATAGSPGLSNRMAHSFLESAAREVGADTLSTILADNHLSPGLLDGDTHTGFNGGQAAGDYAALQQALRKSYGHGARGILLRVGVDMWDRMTSQAGFLEKTELEIARRLPVPARRRRMLEMVAGLLQAGGSSASVHTLDLDLLLVDRSAAATVHQTSNEPICFVTLGLIQGALVWATGQEVDVEEIACKAAGAPACEFKIKLGGK